MMIAYAKPIAYTFRHLTASIVEHAQTERGSGPEYPFAGEDACRKPIRSIHSRRYLGRSNATIAHRLEFDMAMRALIFGILFGPPLRATIGQ
jgi:hypothetical protein